MMLARLLRLLVISADYESSIMNIIACLSNCIIIDKCLPLRDAHVEFYMSYIIVYCVSTGRIM